MLKIRLVKITEFDLTVLIAVEPWKDREKKLARSVQRHSVSATLRFGHHMVT